jgi:rSAM/selenodomain-associated transferase 1
MDGMNSVAGSAVRVLGLFAKRPVAGLVKTRLALATSAEWSAQVAVAFLEDQIDRLSKIDCRRVIVFAPSEAESFFLDPAQGRFELTPQVEGDLGRRMARFLESQFATGASAVVLLGTDSPTMPLEFIDRAFHLLNDHDVVLGPATDGGYYLLGCSRGVPPIFDGIAWGGSTVLEETIARLALTSCRLALLPPWYDVDTPADWQMLRGHLAALRRAGVDPELPRTELLCQADLP